MKLSEKIQEALREQQEINLSDPAVQKRLAAQWGYVPAGAQPAPSVPREAIEKMLTQLMDIAVSNGANSVSMPDEYVEVAAWLCGIPAQPAPSVPEDGLPDRDSARPAEQQGLFRKFVVRRTDGSDAPGGKHYGCRYFVLDVDHDKHAAAALTAYAADCETTHPELAKDLREKWGAQPAPSVPDDGVLKDAERYRFLEHLCATGTYRGIISRKAVDAAMLAAAPKLEGE